MTPKPVAATQPGAPDIIRFPDPRPCDLDVTTYYFVTLSAYHAALLAFLGNPETTVVICEVAAGLRPTQSYADILFPDLLIAFNADPAACRARNGYLIPEQGKPPDFVLEVASETTARRDETVKRRAYEAMGVREYWRFDNTGGDFYSEPLAGDRLINGVYVPIPVNKIDDANHRGYSAALNLELRWEYGHLRWYDPISQTYLRAYAEIDAAREAAESGLDAERQARIASETERDSERQARIASETERDSERQARIAAEARIRRLEEELRRRPNP